MLEASWNIDVDDLSLSQDDLVEFGQAPVAARLHPKPVNIEVGGAIALAEGFQRQRPRIVLRRRTANCFLRSSIK